MSLNTFKKASPLFLLTLFGTTNTYPLYAENNLNLQLLIGTWAEEHNSKKLSKASEYIEKILTCTKANKNISCEASSLYKAAGLPEAGTNTGQITGIIQIAEEPKANSPFKKPHLFIKDQDSDSQDNAIAIEIINKSKIKVTQYPNASLGGLNVIFDGVYLKQSS